MVGEDAVNWRRDSRDTAMGLAVRAAEEEAEAEAEAEAARKRALLPRRARQGGGMVIDVSFVLWPSVTPSSV